MGCLEGILHVTRQYWVADLKANGELRGCTPYHYEHLEQLPGCAELIGVLSGAIWRDPSEFEIDLQTAAAPIADAPPSLGLRWLATADTAGLMTLRASGQLVSITVLASGVNVEADQHTMSALQQHLVAELHGTRFEPSFALLSLHDRPLAATIDIASPDLRAAHATAALADRCFAAAYFRYLRLV